MKHIITLKIIQFSVNSIKATTGHTLQGVSLNRIVLGSWSYQFPNGVYVASRVRAFKGLFICKKMDDMKRFTIYSNLLEEEYTKIE